MSKLFSEFKMKNLFLKNRVVMPPMCMYCAGEDGLVTPWHLIHYGSRAVGGVGLIIQEATGVSPEGRLTSQDLGIWHDGQVEGLTKIVETVHQNGGKIGIQINHAGRKGKALDVEIEAPTALAYEEGDQVPKAMTREDIKETVAEFREAARRANQAGYDFLEIHGAHGYLINQFLSPLTNHRTDEYGGSPENRSRFLGEILDAVTAVWPGEKPLGLRITAEDYQEGGNMPPDLAHMINLVKEKGIDIVNVSTGGLVPVVPKAFPGYQVPHAEQIRQQTALPVMAGGLITEPKLAADILEKEQADLVYVGRELLRNPYWALHSAHDLGDEVDWPEQYLRAKPRR